MTPAPLISQLPACLHSRRVFPMIRRLNGVFFALVLILCACGSSAQNIESRMPSESELRTYVNQRWLYGDSSEMLKALHYRNYQIPVSGIQLSVKGTFTPARNAKVVEDLKAYGARHGAVPITPTQAQQQFELWGDCLVKAYQSDLSSDQLQSLRSLFGVVHFFPRLGGEVEAWSFEAFHRTFNAGGTSLAPTNSAESNDLDEELGGEIYTAVANPVNDIYLAQFVNVGQIGQVKNELLIKTRNFPAIASRLGIDSQRWAVIERYAMSELAGKEMIIYRGCDSSQTYVSPATRSWSTGAFAAMAQYFNENLISLSAD